jgi:AhpD family alkylhydroperoxidase
VKVLILTLGAPILFGASCIAAVAPHSSASPEPLVKLESHAHQRVTAVSRIPLGDSAQITIDPADNFEKPELGHVPNYVRVLASRPGAPAAFAHLFRSVLYAGSVEPETKMGMGLRIAQLESSPYVAAHLQRLLMASSRGRTVIDAIRSGNLEPLGPEQVLAFNYASWLSPDVNGVSDENFRKVRGYFNDSQIVELTLTVCFFEYFTRLAEGANLPVETWVFDSRPAVGEVPYRAPMERIPVITDADMDLISNENPELKQMRNRSSLGLNIANSERAMLWCPDIPQAWWAYGRTIRNSDTLGRDVLLQVSFAVSMANGCRYCTLHQVLGLRKLGVDPEKLIAMRKDDSALTPKELAAVQFARKLTAAPGSATDADFQRLSAEFGPAGAFDVLLQTCTFAFMNHFTDVTLMPSEDIAVQTYREVYGADYPRK